MPNVKKVIKLTETDLHNIIKESVSNILNEDWEKDFNDAMDKMDYIKSKKEYDSKSLFKKILAMVQGKKPIDPNTYYTLEDLLNKYVISFNSEHNIGNLIRGNDGSSFHSRMKYNGDNGYPVLSSTYYDGNVAFQTRREFNKNGNEKELGIEYPYSEFGLTMDKIPDNAKDYAKRQYDNFNRNKEEIRNVIKKRKNKDINNSK